MFAAIKNWWRGPLPTSVKNTDKWKDFFDEVETSRRYTPDLPELERLQWHWFFAIGAMQKDQHQHHLLEGCEMSEYAGFTQDRLMMLKQDLGILSTPLVFNSDLGYKNPPELLPIKGELYKVPSRHFIKIDKELNNTVSCFRRQVRIVIPYSGLWIKDRTKIDRLLPKQFARETKNGKGEKVIRDGGQPQTHVMPHQGVITVFAWMYFADRSFWEDYLDLNTLHPPVKSYDNPKGLIRKYYRFTNVEYNHKPPWFNKQSNP